MKTDARLHKTDVRLHETDARLHETDVRLHKTDVRLHKPDVRFGCNHVRIFESLDADRVNRLTSGTGFRFFSFPWIF
jgi:hypothetical protein